jgi:hypothetical protein
LVAWHYHGAVYNFIKDLSHHDQLGLVI